MTKYKTEKELEITKEMVMSVLKYEPKTGKFTWIRKGLFGRQAGRLDGSGYLQIGINGRRYMAHRIAFLIIHGRWPEKYIDHINGVRDDNRIDNLREAEKYENGQNIKRPKGCSGLMGARKYKDKWQSSIQTKGKRVHLGTFENKEDAAKAYAKAKMENHKFNPFIS